MFWNSEEEDTKITGHFSSKESDAERVECIVNINEYPIFGNKFHRVGKLKFSAEDYEREVIKLQFIRAITNTSS